MTLKRTKKGYVIVMCEDCKKEMSINTFKSHWKKCKGNQDENIKNNS